MTVVCGQCNHTAPGVYNTQPQTGVSKHHMIVHISGLIYRAYHVCMIRTLKFPMFYSIDPVSGWGPS
jgi:hypothetical protein